MPPETRVAGAKKPVKKKKDPVKKVAVKAVSRKKSEGPKYSQYQVKTKGYREQYSDLAAAKKSFETIKRNKLKNEEVFKVTLSGKDKGSWVELDFCQITADHYE